MDQDKNERVSQRAYEIWEAEGRPHGRHHDHWTQAEHDVSGGAPAQANGKAPAAAAKNSSPDGMMGDGTEEQNLGQPGNPGARITKREVEEAFAEKAKT